MNLTAVWFHSVLEIIKGARGDAVGW
jgi:hypothetical protein